MEERRDTPNENTQGGTEGETARSPKDAAREGLSESERIEALRARLYDRGKGPEMSVRHPLTGSKQAPLPQNVERTWQKPQQETPAREIEHKAAVARAAQQKQQAVLSKIKSAGNAFPTTFMPKNTQRNKYRLMIMFGGIAFFIIALGLASMFLLYGNNNISGENITIAISDAPFAIGGGEEISLQVSIGNQNAIPVESATLIVEYPSGTQSATEPGKELFSERLQLNNIAAGELVNVPIRAIVFGEENDEKTINVSIEYRVRGSNATFFKEAEPLRFKISSSPVVLSVESVQSISSGQEAEITLTVGSNSPTPLADVLIKATYPFGFDFTESDPETISGEDTWFIETLAPEEKQTITIRGVITGKQDEERIFSFSAGVPNERDRFNLASIFTSVDSEIIIEQPFLGVSVEINGSGAETVAIEPGERATVRINFENSLESTIYDGVITAELKGNALNEINIDAVDGFYDSSSNIIRWDSTDVRGLDEIAPGRASQVVLSLTPDETIGRTPEITLTVTVSGQRVYEDRVPQELVGTVSRSIRVSSQIALTSSALYSEGPYNNSGPIPPVAEKVTQYTYLLSVQNGSNDITDAEVTAVLPQYITWLDQVTTDDDVSYNASRREMTWDIGDMDANDYEEVWVQVSFLPSLTQVGTTPTILESQRFRATDRFTGEVIRGSAPALTTALLNDPDEDAHNGRVLED